MAASSVLFVVRSYSGTGAQPIRFREIIGHLAGEFDIHVLELAHGKPGTRLEKGVTIHSLEYSFIGKVLNPPVRAAGSAPVMSGEYTRPLAVAKRHIRSLFFPDSVISEVTRLRREAVRLSKVHGFSVVVLSAFPFTVFLCAASLRKNTGARIILDVGDPFFRNSRNGWIRDILARRFEEKHLRFADALVVTNEMTRKHYLESFHFAFPEMIYTIPMGISESLAVGCEREGQTGKTIHAGEPFTLVYAGQFYRKLREPFELYRALVSINAEAGTGVELKIYGTFSREFSSGYGKERIISFMGQVSHGEIARIYRNAGAVVFIDNAFGMQTPGKVFEVVLTGRPVLFITDRSESPALEVIKGFSHVITTINKAEAINAAIERLILMDPVYPAREQVSGFLWENRAAEYKKLISFLSGE